MRDIVLRGFTAVFIAVSGASPGHAQQRQLCVTVDDLPCASCPSAGAEMVNDSLLNVFERHHVPACGFVNEGKLIVRNEFDSAGYRALAHWVMRGQELGNHTYGHVSANNSTVPEYEADVLRGELRTRPLMNAHGKELRYFRHPYLNAGSTPAHRDSLNTMLTRHGYIIAPVTFDNDEYVFAFCYLRAVQEQDSAAIARIGAQYIAYMDSVIRFHETRTHDLLGRDIPQILLLHANLLNAHHLDALLSMLEGRGYRHVSLDEALRDPAYRLPEATTPHGFSWIRRWEVAAGRLPPWPPEPPEEIMRAYELGQRNRAPR